MNKKKLFYFLFCLMAFSYASLSYANSVAVLISTMEDESILKNEIQKWETDENINQYFDKVIAIYPVKGENLTEKKYIMEKLNTLSTLQPRQILYFIFGEVNNQNKFYAKDFKPLRKEFTNYNAKDIAIICFSSSNHHFKLKKTDNLNFCLANIDDNKSFLNFREKFKESGAILNTKKFEEDYDIPLQLVSGNHFSFSNRTNSFDDDSYPKEAEILTLNIVGKEFDRRVFPECINIASPIYRDTDDATKSEGEVVELLDDQNETITTNRKMKCGATITPVIYNLIPPPKKCRIPKFIKKEPQEVIFPDCLNILSPDRPPTSTTNELLHGKIAWLEKEDGTNLAEGSVVEKNENIYLRLYRYDQNENDVEPEEECKIGKIIGSKLSDATIPGCIVLLSPEEGGEASDIEAHGTVISLETKEGNKINNGDTVPPGTELTPIVLSYKESPSSPSSKKLTSCKYNGMPKLFLRIEENDVRIYKANDNLFSSFEKEKTQINLKNGYVLDYVFSPQYLSPYFYVISTLEEENDDQYRIRCRVYCKSDGYKPLSKPYDTLLKDNFTHNVKELEGNAFAQQISNKSILVCLIGDNLNDINPQWFEVKSSRGIVAFDFGFYKGNICLSYITNNGKLFFNIIESSSSIKRNEINLIEGGFKQDEYDKIQMRFSSEAIYLFTPLRGIVFNLQHNKTKNIFNYENKNEIALFNDLFKPKSGSRGIFSLRRIKIEDKKYSYKGNIWIYKNGNLNNRAENIDFSNQIEGAKKIDEIKAFIKQTDLMQNRYSLIIAYNTGKGDDEKGVFRKFSLRNRKEWELTFIKDENYDSLLMDQVQLLSGGMSDKVGVFYYDYLDDDNEASTSILFGNQ